MTVTDFSSANWNLADGTGSVGVTEAILRKALKVAVESLQGNFNAETNTWKRSEVKSLDAKAASSGGG